MTPISAIASLPISGPEQEPNGDRAARRTGPGPDVAPAVSDASPVERSFWDRLWGKEGFSFGAVLDIINPLQHIPIVSTIYRAATGDTIGPGRRMIGGAIFGGVVGLITSAADAAIEGITGKDTGSHVMAMLPEPEPVSQWALDDVPRSRTWRTAYLNQLNGLPPQIAAQDAPDKATAAETIAASADAVTHPTGPELKVTQAVATSPSVPAAEQRFNRPFTPPPRTAQLGAGGQLVPMATNGRPGSNLPSAKELAANPALLQEMRQGGVSAINASQKNTGRIDTAIRGHGLVTPGLISKPAQNNPAAAWHDRMARESQAIALDAEPKAKNTLPETPEVVPDFLIKMQQALDKYQARRPAPTVDITH